MVRAETRSARGYANQRGHDLRIGPQPEYVDGSRSHLNRVIMEPPTAPEMRRIVEERRALRETARSLKANAGIAVIAVIGFGTEAARLFSQLTQEQQDKAFLEAAKRIADIANTTVVGAVLHLDETSIHAHLSLVGYDLDGLPLSTTMKRGMLTKFQDVLAEVMAEHCPGIERGNSKWKRIEAGASYAETIHKTVAEMHGSLEDDYKAKLRRNEELELVITEKVARVREMQDRVDKLESLKSRLTAAQEKRLTTYKNRLTGRQAELSAAREELSSLKTALDSLTAKVSDLEAQKATSEAERDKAAKAAERALEGQKKAEEELTSLDLRKNTLETTIQGLEAEKEASEAALAPLEQKRDDLTAHIQDLVGQEAQSLAAAQRAEKEKAAAEAAAQKAEEDRKFAIAARNAVASTLAPLHEQKKLAEAAAQKAEEDRQKAVEAKRVAEAALAPLEAQSAALGGQIAGMAATVQELRPAFDVAHALRLLTADHSRDEELFEMMPPPGGIQQGLGQDHVDSARDAWATALRMTDPYFALNVAPDVPRAPEPEVNRDTLISQDTSDEDYNALVAAMKAEPGNHHRAVSGLLSGEIQLSDLSSAERAKDPEVSWVARAFAGLKRGVVFAAEAVSERSAKLAAVFEALPTAAQAALSALFRSQSADALGQKNEEPQRRRSVFDLDR